MNTDGSTNNEQYGPVPTITLRLQPSSGDVPAVMTLLPFVSNAYDTKHIGEPPTVLHMSGVFVIPSKLIGSAAALSTDASYATAYKSAMPAWLCALETFVIAHCVAGLNVAIIVLGLVLQ